MQQEAVWYSLSPKLAPWLIAFAVLFVMMVAFGVSAALGNDGSKGFAGLTMLALMFLLIPIWRRRRSARFWSLFRAKISFFDRDGATAMRFVLHPKRDITLPGLYVVCWPSFYTKVQRVSNPLWLLSAAKEEAAQLRLMEDISLKANQPTTLEVVFQNPAGAGGRDELAIYVLPASQPPIGFSFHLIKSAGVFTPESNLLPPTSPPEHKTNESSYREGTPDTRHIMEPPNPEQIRSSVGRLQRLSIFYFLGVVSFVLGVFLFLSFLGSQEIQPTLLRVISWISFFSFGFLFASRLRLLSIVASLGLAGFYYKNTLRWSGLSIAEPPEEVSYLLSSWALWYLIVAVGCSLYWIVSSPRRRLLRSPSQ